jgi:Na+-transporting NADH:ubiquinone oxidoreductase subunit C
MQDTPKNNFIHKWLETSPDKPSKTITIAVGLCLVCAMLVAYSAISLRPFQEANALNDKRKNILEVAGIFNPTLSIEEQFNGIETRIVDLKTQQFDQTLNPLKFDMFDESVNPFSTLKHDPAKIVKKPRYATIYLVNNDKNQIETVILPVYGYGLWSTMYGFIALNTDLNHIKGLKFYQQGETPGLGAEVDNPRWRNLWINKKIFDNNGNIKVHVSKGASLSENAQYGVDAISGASMTSRGVHNLLRFWLGDNGFKAFLQQFKKELDS